jgi:hypothetical protein
MAARFPLFEIISYFRLSHNSTFYNLFTSPGVSKTNITFDNGLGILILEFENQLEPQLVIDYYNQLFNNTSYPRKLAVLCHVTSKSYSIKPGNLPEIIRSHSLACTKYEQLKEAFLAEDPYSTALTTLFSKKANCKNYRSAVFSTREAALKWLLH